MASSKFQGKVASSTKKASIMACCLRLEPDDLILKQNRPYEYIHFIREQLNDRAWGSGDHWSPGVEIR